MFIAFLGAQESSHLTTEVELNRVCHRSLKTVHMLNLWTCLFVQMEFVQCFAPSDFQKIFFFMLMEFLKKYLPRLSTRVSLVMFDPLENNHG